MRASWPVSMLLLLCLCPPTWARRDDARDWRQLTTEHFVIIYPEQAAAAASQAADVAEEAYPRVQKLFGYAPASTALVLNEFQDAANGFTQPLYPKMEFYLASPTGKFDGTLNRSWLESLMYHEFAHMCYGSRSEGLTRGLTWIFGGVNYFNFIAPGWWTEGVAEYSETVLTAGGRGRNPYHRMKLAANALSDQPWSLGQIGSAPLFDFPNDRVYVAGYEMVRRLFEATADPAFLDRAAAQQSAWPLFGLSFVWFRQFHLSLGNFFQQARADWQLELAREYGAERPAAPGCRIACEDAQGFYSLPHWLSPDRLAAFRQDLNDGPALVQIELPAATRRVLFRPAFLSGGLCYAAPQKTFFYARDLPSPWDDNTLTADLFAWDGREERRLTFNARCWSPDVAADGRIVCVVNRSGATQLAVLDPAGGRLRPVPGPPGAVYLSPRWSPDGRRLATAVGINGVQDVCLVDPASGALTAVTGWDAAGDYDPCWSPDGNWLFFGSDRTGVHQIYAYDLDRKSLFQVTDARLGAFEPDVSPDGKWLAFSEYRPGNSQRIVTAPLEAKSWKPVSLANAHEQPAPPKEFLLPPAHGSGYSAWPYLAPSFWVPYTAEDRDGWTVGGLSGRQDPLDMHSWVAQAYVQPASGRVYGDFTYTNEETFLVLTGDAFSRPYYRWGRGSSADTDQRFWARAQGVEADVSLPVNLLRAEDRSSQVQGSVGYEAFSLLEQDTLSRDTAADPALPAVQAFPDAGYTGLKAGLHYAYARQTDRDLFPISGVALDVQGRWAVPGHGYYGSIYAASAGWAIPSLFAHQAFQLSARSQAVHGVFPDTPVAVYPTGWTWHFPAPENALTLSAGYFFPLWYIDNGAGLFPMYFRSLWGEVFADWGNAWNGVLQPNDWPGRAVSSLGLAANLDVEFLWFLPGRVSQVLVRRQDGSWYLNLNFSLGI